MFLFVNVIGLLSNSNMNNFKNVVFKIYALSGQSYHNGCRS